jgi:hypothetical protein
VDSWFSFEIVSFEGDVHLYIRTPDGHRDLVESQIYGVYPDAEIQEVEDYISGVPDDVPNEDYDIWGTDMKLGKDSAYPIRTYKEFEDTASGDFVDPIGNIVEGVNKLGPGEQIWIQILTRPTDDSWKKNARNIVLKLAGREVKKPKGGFFTDLNNEIMLLARHVALDFFHTVEDSKAEEKKSSDLPSMMLHLSSGERALIDGIDLKRTSDIFIPPSEKFSTKRRQMP